MNLDFEGHEEISYPFGNENILDDIDQFTSVLNQIAAKRNALFCHKSREEIIELQDALDYINHLFDYDFCNIKKSVFPNLWRFGIKASVTPISIGVNGKVGNPVNSSVLALYPQMKGTVDTGIQEYSHDRTNFFNHISLGGKIEPIKYAKEAVHKALISFFEQGIPAAYLPDIVLQEKIWPFIERINKFFPKNDTKVMTVEEIESRYQYILMYIDRILTSKDLSNKELEFKSTLINQFLHTRHSINVSSILGYGGSESFREFYKREKGRPFSVHTLIPATLDRDSIEILGIIEELKVRCIKEISIVWEYDLYRLRTLEKEHFLICLDEITSKWLSNLPDLYNETYERLIDTSNYKLHNKIQYQNYYSDFGFGMNRFSTLIHKYDSSSFSIQKVDNLSKVFNEELKQKGLSLIISGISLDNFIDNKLLYFESLSCLIYKGICEKLEFKPKDLHIGSNTFTRGLSLF